MTCDLSPVDLSAYLDGALVGEAARRAEEHAGSCLRCREALGAWRGLEAGLRGEVDAPPPRVEASLALAVRRTGARRRRSRVAAAALFAAACGGAAYWGLLAGRGDETVDQPPRYAPALREATLVKALELDAGAIRLELASLDSGSDREAELAARLDALLRRLDRLRLDLEDAR
jgi:anti-sigma factor RsiW